MLKNWEIVDSFTYQVLYNELTQFTQVYVELILLEMLEIFRLSQVTFFHPRFSVLILFCENFSLKILEISLQINAFS